MVGRTLRSRTSQEQMPLQLTRYCYKTRLRTITVLHQGPLKDKINKRVLMLPDMLSIRCTSPETLCMVTESIL